MSKSTKDLRKLSRLELLDMLIEQAKEIEALKAELAQANEKLASRQLVCDQAGNLAEAALKLNQIFEAAQAAANQYLESVKSGGYRR